MSAETNKLHQAARFGWLWASIEQFGARAISLVVGIILARLLRPEDFGLLASVSIFMTVAQQIIDGGIAQRVIQKEEVGEPEYRALFFGNLVMSGMIAAALICSAGAISGFFGLPELKALVMVLGGSVFLSNAGRVQLTRLTREMAYRRLAIIRLAAASTGAVVGVGMALSGFGIWALVGQLLAGALVTVILLWLSVPWRPSGLPTWASIVDLYTFGLPVVVSQTIRSAANQMVNVLTAKFYSPAILGYYDRGRLMPQTLTVSMGNVLSKVNFPALAKLQNDATSLRSTYLSFLGIGFGAAALVLTSMAVYAHEFVYLVLGEKWLPSTWFFQVICGLGIIHVAYLLNADLLRSLGKTRVFFRVNMLCAGLQVVFVVFGLHWGVRGMVLGDVSARFVAALVMAFVVARNSPVRSGDQLREVLRSLVWVGPLLLLLLGLKLGVDNMLAKVVLGLVVCMSVTWFWWKREGQRVTTIA